MIQRLSDKIALMFQRAFAQIEVKPEDGSMAEWAWEIAIMPHAQQGTVLYIALMAPAVDNSQRIFSTGLAIPGPSSINQDSANSLATTLVEQIRNIRANDPGTEGVVQQTGSFADGSLGAVPGN